MPKKTKKYKSENNLESYVEIPPLSSLSNEFNIIVDDEHTELEFKEYKTSEIPNIIWAFWDNKNTITSVVTMCVESWKFYNPEMTILFLDNDSVVKYIPGINEVKFNYPQSKSDYVRSYILCRYGGFWIDGSIICHHSLNWIHGIQRKYNVDFVGYYLNKLTDPELKNTPMIENWFFACIKYSPFMLSWHYEYLNIYNFPNTESYIKHIKKEGVNLHGLPKNMEKYLKQHVASQVVLQLNPHGNIYLLEAENGPFAYIKGDNWHTSTTKDKCGSVCKKSIDSLVNKTHENLYIYPLIKLTGEYREELDKRKNKTNAFSNKV